MCVIQKRTVAVAAYCKDHISALLKIKRKKKEARLWLLTEQESTSALKQGHMQCFTVAYG